MEDFGNIINWENVHKNSEAFKKCPIPRYGFVEEFFERKFYEKLYETWPNEGGEGWIRVEGDYSRSAMRRSFGKNTNDDSLRDEDDPNLSKEWNKFRRYMKTDEFVNNVAKYTGIPLKKVVIAGFTALFKGDFNLVHNHFEESSIGMVEYDLSMFFYFSKNWQKGDPGGTYMASEEDESSIIFETCNLDNTMFCFQESQKSWHGTRYITKDVVRRAVGIMLK